MNADWARTIASMRHEWRGFARVDGGRWLEEGGVEGSVFPAAPERSVFNAVVSYGDAEALERAYDAVAAAYDEAGIQAWTVWVPGHDTAAAALLEAKGHALDADPANMLLDLGPFEPLPAREDADWSRDGTIAEWAAVNEGAYPWGDGSMRRAIEALEGHATDPVYVVREDGRAMAVLGMQVHGDDAYISLVATLPEARGRGYAGLLMNEALRDAKERGCATSSLQATKKGEPVYARVGYRTLGPFQMWERRRA